jgi:hypothetical protein
MATTPITVSPSAMLRFLNEDEALAYDDFIHAHHILIRGARLQTSLIRTASWPLSDYLVYQIRDVGRTRCVFIEGFDEKIPPEKMRRFLRLPYSEEDANGGVDMELFRRKGLEIRFASVEFAGYAYEKIRGHKAFDKCRVEFVKDPCAEPLVTLLGRKKAGFGKDSKGNCSLYD